MSATPGNLAPSATGNASTTDLLSSLKALVLALNNATQTYLNVNGLTVTTAISAPTVVKTTSGRIVNISVTTAGSAVGHVYDANQLGATTKPLYIIPMAIGTTPYEVNLPASIGLLIVPGTGQTLAASWS